MNNSAAIAQLLRTVAFLIEHPEAEAAVDASVQYAEGDAKHVLNPDGSITCPGGDPHPEPEAQPRYIPCTATLRTVTAGTIECEREVGHDGPHSGHSMVAGGQPAPPLPWRWVDAAAGATPAEGATANDGSKAVRS